MFNTFVSFLTRCLPILLVSISLAGCSSLKKKAAEQLQSGNYDAAIDLFEKHLAQNPGDPEAQTGLKEARTGWLDKTLIAVRMARLGGNQNGAMDLLLTVIQREAKWAQYAAGNVAFTQEEETGFAFPYYESKVLQSVRNSRPLQAEQFANAYTSIFQNAKYEARKQILKAEIGKIGRKSCKDFEATVTENEAFFAVFLNRYCSHFGETCTQCTKAARAASKELYRTLDVETNVDGFNPNYVDIMTYQLKKALVETPWYSSDGVRKATLHINGQFQTSHEKNMISLVHTYTVSEPYETVEYVTKSRPKSATPGSFIPVGNNNYNYNSGSNPYNNGYAPSGNGAPEMEYYQEAQKVVRYRYVEKNLPYQALKHLHLLDWTVDGKVEFADRQIILDFHENDKEEGIEHDMNLPQIGLRPSRPRFIEDVEWIKDKSRGLANKFKSRIQSDWHAAFCTSAGFGNSISETGNQVQKCMRANPSTIPSFVHEWYMNQMGLDYKTVESELSK